jgi:uncharacterized protein (DUF2235 family)
MILWRKIISNFRRNGSLTIENAPDRFRASLTHVIIIDGTMSALRPGIETNAGQAYKLIKGSLTKNTILHYFPGIQLQSDKFLSSCWAIITGNGINLQIMKAYGALASRYQYGDQIILIGYSRGAFAVRSLAGIIDIIGLLRGVHATQRNVVTAFRYYKNGTKSETALVFQKEKCHPTVKITAIGVWDTVKALGLPLPLVSRFFNSKHQFHNDQISKSVGNGFHALALDETRNAYRPVMWTAPVDWQGVLEQRWFRGNHRDIGGQISGWPKSRPLANIPFVWIMQRLEDVGLNLRLGWRDEFPLDVMAPSTANWWREKLFCLSRSKRQIGHNPSELIHGSVPVNALGSSTYLHDQASS